MGPPVPIPKFIKFLQKMPIITLIAVSIAAQVRTLIFDIKIPPYIMLHKEVVKPYDMQQRDANLLPQGLTPFRPDGNSPSVRHLTHTILTLL